MKACYFMDNSTKNKFQVTKGSALLRLREILMDSDGLITLVKLNFFFLVTTLPFVPGFIFFTGGASITALLHCTNILVKTGSVPDVRKTYFNIFKVNFKKTFFAGLAVTLLNILFIGGLVFYLILASANFMYLPFASVSLLAVIAVWSVTIHLFPAFTEHKNESNSLKEMVMSAITAAMERMKQTMIAVAVSLFVISGVILMLPNTLPLVLTVIFSVPALAAGFAHTDSEFISDII